MIQKIVQTFNDIIMNLGNRKYALGRGVKIRGNCFFEGANRIRSKTIFTNSSIGFASYVSCLCRIENTQIGRYCCIANNVNVICGRHPTHTFVSIHPAFFR